MFDSVQKFWMVDYLDGPGYVDYLSQGLPFSPWVALAIGVGLSIAAHIAFMRARSAAEQQDGLKVEGQPNTTPLSFRLVLARTIFGIAVFAVGMWLGEPAFSFFFGGFLIASVVSIASSIRAYLFLTALRDPSAKGGTLQLSITTATRDQAYQLGTAAFLTLCSGLITANVALLGATLFLGSTSVGYLRRAKAARR